MARLNLKDQAHMARLKAEIDKAWDDPTPSRAAAEVFDEIEALHEETSRSKPIR